MKRRHGMDVGYVMSNSYEVVVQELKHRIIDLIPTNPEIMEMKDPFDLFKINEFKSSDLKPTIAQASYALAYAQKEFKAK